MTNNQIYAVLDLDSLTTSFFLDSLVNVESLFNEVSSEVVALVESLFSSFCTDSFLFVVEVPVLVRWTFKVSTLEVSVCSI